MNLPFVSVIIVNLNGKKHLKNCISSLKRTNYPSDRLETIVVDNNSSDGSVEFLRKLFPEVVVLELDRNYGFTGGNNRGARIAKGDLLVFLNNDTEVTENWLIELVNVTKRDNKIGICGSKILFGEQRDMIQYAGGFLNILGGAVSPFIWTLDRFEINSKPTGYVCGACMLIKKEVFRRLGGFDEDYFMYSDENDLCLRCWLLGYTVMYVPRSVVYHMGEGTMKQERDKRKYYDTQRKRNPLLEGRIISDLRLYYTNRNSLYNLWKCFEPMNILIGMVGSGIYLFLQIFSLLRKREPQKILILFTSLLSYLENLPKVWSKRHYIQKSRTRTDKELFDKGLLISLGPLISLALRRSS